MKMDQEDVFHSFKYLTNIGITVDDIRKQPSILCSNETVLRNRHEILVECGCFTTNAFFLNKYTTMSRESEAALKKIEIIDSNINLQQRLADCLSVELHPCNADLSLTAVRMHCLRLFYLQNDFMTGDEFDAAIRQYPYARYKSYRTIKAITELLIEQFRIPKDKIKDNFNALQADPDNVRKLLTIKPIGGVNMADILQQTPCLLLASYDGVLTTLAHLKKFGISEEAIANCFRVLAMDPKIVGSRLSEFKLRKELQPMNSHPFVLKLIVHKFKAHSRLEHFD